MKISVYSVLMLLLAAQLLVAATTGAQDIRQASVTIGFTNATLNDALQSLQKKSGYNIFYLSKPVSRYRDISLPTENRSVHKTLELLLDRTTIAFKQEGNSIVLTEQEAITPPVKSRPPVKGKVTDRAGQGLPGVTVILKGTSKGTTTDQSGSYSLDVPSETATLVFSFVGYLSQEVSVGNKTDIDILLAPDERALDEIVVVGYGSKTKREVTGAISSVQSKAISEQAVTGFDQAMAGRVAGVQIVQNSASPGGNTSIRVRGVGTPGVSEPLYVIDGVPVFDASVPSMINPNDIESIEVLKDAASGAIYGARGANGVVLISTKQGKKGPAKVSLNYYYGVQSFQKRFDMLGADDYKNFLRARNTPFTDSNADTDWFREITGPAPIQNANLSLQGGSESTNYFVSADYIDQKGIIKNTDFKRFTTRFNLQSKISTRLRVGTNLTVGKSWRRTRSENSIWSLLGTALYYPPIVPVREAGGQYGDATEYVAILNSNNPLAQAEVGSFRSSQLSMLGNLFAEYEPVKGLSYKLNLGVNYKGDVSDNYFPGYRFGVKGRTDGNPNVGKGMNNQTVWLIENTLTYKLELNNTHRFTLLAGATQQESNGESLYGQRLNAVSKDPTLISINSSPAVLQRASGGFDSWSIASFLGRFDYSYKGKYLLTASVRRDGSSKFAPGRRWGTFPSVSAGWVISDEKFFNVRFISDLKLRASWGQLGNQEIAAFQYLSTLGTVSYLFGNNTVAGVYPNNVANRSITWETSKQTDIGLDMTLFNNKVTVGIDYFDKKTDGILLTDPITSVYGYTDAGGGVINSTKNAGLIANRGFEFSLGYQHRQGAFRWSANANAATLRNEVLSLGGGAPLINSMNLGLYTTRTDVGGQIGAFYGKVVERVGEDGHFVFVKGPNGQDLQTNIGNPIPSLTYGFNANADYRNFDFSMAWQGVAGNDIYAATLFQTGNFSYSTNNLIKRIYDQAGTTAPAVAVANGADYAGSSWFVYDGSFLRLRSLQIGYTLPATSLKRIGLDRVRLYVTGQNLLTFDKYDVGLNPEVGAFNQNNVAAGMDQGAYPTPRTVTTGLNVTF